MAHLPDFLRKNKQPSASFKGDRYKAKPILSKNLMKMKFMQQSQTVCEDVGAKDDHLARADDEHWVLNLPHVHVKDTKYDVTNSYSHCLRLRFGRRSFKGFNPIIEKLCESIEEQERVALTTVPDDEVSVTDRQMARHYDSLVETISRKFGKKRDRASVTGSKGAEGSTESATTSTNISHVNGYANSGVTGSKKRRLDNPSSD